MKMTRGILILILGMFPSLAFTQDGQLSISRINQMPDSPSPLSIRDWKRVAQDYDQLVFDLNRTGTYLPLCRLGTQGQYQYADNTPIFLDSYVGANSHLNQAEAINIMPAIVGASLVGIDKSNQNGRNWVAMTKDFFNWKNKQNVYLNGYMSASGNDWWYDVMPNIFFYQLRYLYPHITPEFDTQFISVADRWLNCIKQLGGSTAPWTLPNMNYRAFNLLTGQPLATGVPEPESAGSIAWLLYNAYQETGERKYRVGAQLAMDYLTTLSSNPSYELQLSYGTLIAARMNAMEGTNYPIQKLLDWCFNRGNLRGWGSIIGTWGTFDVSGLIGEANDSGNDYAFVMNGFQQVAALAPISKYDKRYARSLAKWILNITNASRLFYWNTLPESNQDSFAWASANDPDACIPHESMKEVKQGKSPYATGDAISGGWAATNLSLYSGSGVGYLAAVVEKTNVPEILQIDLNKTDFYGDNFFSTYLFYNPGNESKTINVTIPGGSVNVYDAITESVLATSVSDSVHLTLPAGAVRLVRLFPSDLLLDEHDGKLFAGGHVLDYHYRYNYSSLIRIKSLSTACDTVAKNTLFTAFCEADNIPAGAVAHYAWLINNIDIANKDSAAVHLMAPDQPARITIKCRISVNEVSVDDSIPLQVVDFIPQPPVITGLTPANRWTVTGARYLFNVGTTTVPGEMLAYSWSTTNGSITDQSDNQAHWQAPSTPGISTVTVTVTNQYRLSATASASIIIKDTTLSEQEPLIWYPFDYDDRNAAANRFHATVSGPVKTDDARGNASLAYRFTAGSDKIYTDNQEALNFTNAVSLSCWAKCEQLGSERFLVSHGSWQQRYKLSITPEGYIRWTVKTTNGVADLDGSAPIGLNRYYHITALYTGYSMELYIDGLPDAFKAFSGAILPSTKPLTIGRMDNTETQYAFRGSIDEVKIWDREIPQKQIAQLKNQWLSVARDTTGDPIKSIYPNPVHGSLHLDLNYPVDIETISIYSSDGRTVADYYPAKKISQATIAIPQTFSGFYIFKVILTDGRTFARKLIIGR